MGVGPAPGCGSERGIVIRPIMECGGVEIGSAWPNDRVDFWIERDLGKDLRITKGPIKLPLKNGFKINRSGQTVVEAQTQRIWRNDVERSDAEDGMFHDANLLQGNDR